MDKSNIKRIEALITFLTVPVKLLDRLHLKTINGQDW